MMGQDLEDLVIDENIRRDNKKGKGILTILALLIAILIIVIMMAKMVIGENEPNPVVKKTDEASLISPELLLDDEDTNKDSKSDGEKLDDMTSLLDDKKSFTKNEIKGDTVEVNDDSKDVKPEKEREKPKREEVKKEKIVKEEKPKAQPKVEEKPKPKPVREKKVEKREEKPKNRSSEGSYYIQVGSFSHKPSNRFLSVITNSGFSYKLHSSGKLLIGSYSSRTNANSDLPRVKDRINKSAFVIKIK